MPDTTPGFPAGQGLDLPGSRDDEPEAQTRTERRTTEDGPGRVLPAPLAASVAGRWFRRWHLWVLGLWTLICFVRFAHNGGVAWHFLTQGSVVLFGGAPGRAAPPGGLHLYANYPELQMGPVAFVVAEVLRQFGPHQGVFVAEAVSTAVGLYMVYELERIALVVRPDLGRQRAAFRGTVLVGGAVFLAGWAELTATFTHLDDATALILSLLAVRAAIAGRPVLTGVWIGLATDAKPWALVFLPLVFMLPVRAWVRALAGAFATIAVAWLPFVIADPHTMAAAHYTIRNLPGSALRALGVRDPRTPSWDRPAQLLVGWALATAAVWRRRWPAVVVLGVGARIALDPADHGYYTAGILLGAMLWDLLGPRRLLPVCTVASYAALTLDHAVIHNSVLLGQLRLALVIALAAVILFAPPWPWAPVPADNPALTPDS